MRLALLLLALVAVAGGMGLAQRRGHRLALLTGQLLAFALLVELGAVGMMTLHLGPWAEVTDQARGESEVVVSPLPRRFVIPRSALPLDGRRFGPSEGERRLLVVGDSFARGQGVSDAERFSELVADELPGVVGINVAMPGMSFGDEAMLYLDAAANYAPDVVVWTFVLNDLGGGTPEFMSSHQGHDDFIVDRRRAAEGPSVAAGLAQRLLSERSLQAATEASYRRQLDPERNGEQLEHFGQLMEEVVHDVTDRGGRFLFVIFPLMHQLHDYPFRETHDTVARLAAEHGAEVLDLLPAFEGLDAPALWVSQRDHHPNAAGHAIAAEQITLRLKTGWPETTPRDCTAEHGRNATWQRAAVRLCEHSQDPEAWMTWATLWHDGTATHPIRPLQSERMARFGVINALLLTEGTPAHADLITRGTPLVQDL